MKKIASILLSFMIIMIVLLVFPNVVKAEEIPIDAGTIYAGDTKTITVSNPGETYYYNFTPDESTLYVLWSEENTADPCGYLLDSEDNQIEYNDDGNGNQNFLIKKELEKDVHYKIKVKLYGDDKTGEFKIKLLKITSINDGAMSIGTVTKNVGNNERRYATFTPNETGTYNVTAVASKRFYFKFAGSSFTAERVHDSFHLEKDKEYKIEYYILDYTADSIDITINKCLPIQNGTLSINSDNVITNNNENQFYEYTFEITESNNYFLVGDYNDEVSKDFKVEILKPGNTDWDTYTGIGSYRLKKLETGTYSARIYLNGSATVKIIGQIAIDFGNLKLGDQKTVGFTGVAKRYTYTITPTESDVYRLFSDENEFDPCAYLYNSNGEEIKYSDDDGYGQNFSITYYLEEGKTYVLTVEAYDCTKNGLVRINIIKDTEHTHNYNTHVTNSTCTEKGYTTHRCYNCGYEYKDNFVDELGHDLDTGVITNPTCTEKGYTTHNCYRCSEKIKDTYTNALGHDLDAGIVTNPTCTEKGYTTHNCSRCSEKVKDTYTNALGHSYVIYSIKKATLSLDGEIIKKCTRCNNETKETILHPTTITLSKTEFTYNKKVQKPTVTVKDSKGKVIALSNYTITYSNNNSKKVGKYSVIITFKGNYEGTKTLTYNIKPKGTSLSKLTAGKKQFKAVWKKQTTETTGYELQYSTNKNFKSGNKKVTIKKNKTTTSTVKKLKAKKKYYVRIRTFKTVNGKKIYSGWSKVKNVTTKK